MQIGQCTCIHKFTFRTYLTSRIQDEYILFRELKPGSVYDVVGFSRNKYGWSMHSKTFTFFNKGVGKTS